MLIVAGVAGLATVQDLGRPGAMHEAVPPGGALVPELLAAANRRARNRDDAAAIEVFGRLVVRAAEIDVAVATADAARLLAPGEELVVASEPRRVAYLAMRGGVHAPIVLGGRGALPSARIGTTLHAGARVTTASAPPIDARGVDPFDATATIRVVPGPDRDAFADGALAALCAAPYRIATASDRVGTRLDGTPIPRRAAYAERSRPMVRGAVEVPRDGAPIVLGPDHPTTGGYPIVAVIARADLGKLFAIRLTGTVRFESLRS